MNYRHLYHAGNFADVFKHLILLLIIQSLQRKDKPFCYLDTHAGIGRYDLFSEAAKKTREFDTGILALIDKKNSPLVIKDYLAIVGKINNDFTQLRFYPGSPLIVRPSLRPQDRMILTELHPEDIQILKQEFLHDKQVAVHHLDGYQALKAFLPLKERRGLVFIDPPYEQVDEFEHLTSALINAYKRWATGIYAIWYPLKNLIQVKNFYQNLRSSLIPKILLLEFAIRPLDSPLGLNGCGMIIINPPYQLDKQLQQLLPWLCQTLSYEGKGYYHVEHLTL